MRERETTAADIVMRDVVVAGEALGQVTKKLRPRVQDVFARTVVRPAVRKLQKVFRL